jgi:hypothetical protein
LDPPSGFRDFRKAGVGVVPEIQEQLIFPASRRTIAALLEEPRQFENVAGLDHRRKPVLIRRTEKTLIRLNCAATIALRLHQAGASIAGRGWFASMAAGPSLMSVHILVDGSPAA